MSGHDNAHHEAHEKVPRSKTAFTASFWLVIILAGLFIAALNFINVMGHDEEEGHGGEAKQEMTAPAHGESNAIAPEHQAGATEHADPTPAEQAHPAADSAHH